MYETVVNVHDDDGVADTVRTMREQQVRRVPVIDRENGVLRGIVALDEILRLVGREMNDVAILLEGESLPTAPR